MAFCSSCGAQQISESPFCGQCGKPIQSEAPVVGESEPTFGASPAKKPGLLSKFPKPVLIAAPIVVVLAIVGAVIGIKAMNAPTKANADTFIATPTATEFDSKEDDDVTDYTVDRIFGEDCGAGQELTTLLASGELWTKGGVQRVGESQNYFHLDQQIIAMQTEDDAKSAITAATNVASDDTCDSSSYSSSIAYKFDYENAQSLQKAFGAGGDGVAISSTSWIYMKLSELTAATESNSDGYYAFVRRGNLIMVIYLSSSEGLGGESDFISKADLVKAAAPLIAKFSG